MAMLCKSNVFTLQCRSHSNPD